VCCSILWHEILETELIKLNALGVVIVTVAVASVVIVVVVVVVVMWQN
jgi:hypothetical protein